MISPAHTLPLLQLASKWRGRTVGLYGGSFNPAHEGHLHVALEAVRRLKLDAVWMMVSPGNPLKEKTDVATLERRTQSLQDIVQTQPKILVTDVEKKLGTRYSVDTIKALQTCMPKTRFVWIMGADNLVDFHRWRNWRDIAGMLPIAIFDRPGYSVSGLNSKFARQFGQNQVPYRQLLSGHIPAWTFVPIPRHIGSATNIRRLKGNKWWR